jgi:hypothetical protein
MKAAVMNGSVVENIVRVNALNDVPNLIQIDGLSVSIGDVYDANTGTFSAPAPAPLPEGERIQEIKLAASAQILALASEERQRNLLARVCELLNMKMNNGGTLPGPEAAELAGYISMWGWIKAVRAASNAAEQEAGKRANQVNWPDPPV